MRTAAEPASPLAGRLRARRARRLAVCAAAVAALAAPPVAAPAVASASPAPAVPASKASVLVDVDTGRVIEGVDEHEPLPPASLTKTITALIAVAWLPPGTEVPGSARAANVEPDRVGMKPGQNWSLDDTLQSLLIISANDAAYALAERVSGTEEAFGPLMDQAAAEMGMADHPVFRDPAGLDGSEGVNGGNLVSARDLAIAGRDLLAQPQLASIVAMKHLAFTGPDGVVYGLRSHNLWFLNSYAGAIGVKTGFTDRAGECIIAAARRDGRTMLAVVMGGQNTVVTASDLLDKGFATPVAAEPDTDTLPPVVLPTPALTAARNAPPPTTRKAAVTPTGSGRSAERVASAPAAATGGSSRSWAAGAVAASAAVIALVAARRRRRRRRPFARRP